MRQLEVDVNLNMTSTQEQYDLLVNQFYYSVCLSKRLFVSNYCTKSSLQNIEIEN